MPQNMEYIQALKEIKSTIISNINICNGVLIDSVENMLTDGIVIDIGWKGNVHLQVYYRGSRYFYMIIRNEEQVSAGYYAGKLDESFFKSIQKLINEIENGDFDKKKTRREKIIEIVQRRKLTSYMNQTKWKEFLYAITEEMPIAPPYDYKTLFEDIHEKPCFGTAYDRESFNYYDFKSIEWVKIKPCFEEHVYQGRLMEDKIIHHNVEAEFLALMEKYNIPYEYDSIKEVYVIYGYK